MGVRVLYLQSNERIAGTVKNSFNNENIEFLIVPTAASLFEVCKAKEITLALIDANIPDMKFGDFLDKCSRDYPDMRLNVCIDLADIKQIDVVTRNSNIRKIYVAPWNVDDIVTGVEATIDEILVAKDLKKRQLELKSQEENFEQTLQSLKESLIRQQYSYSKLHPFFDGMLKKSADESELNENVKVFVRKSCNRLLVMETTASVKPSEIAAVITDNIRKQWDKTCVSNIRPFEATLPNDISRSMLIRIVYSAWLLTYMASEYVGACDISIEFDEKSSDAVTYVYTLSGKEYASLDTNVREYVEKILKLLTDDYRLEVSDNTVNATLDFKL